MSKVRVDVWADLACPWCYVGKRHLERALGQFRHRDRVEVVWRSFELDPLAPKIDDASGTCIDERSAVEGGGGAIFPRGIERLARRCGAQPPQAQAVIDRATEVAGRAGLELRLDRRRGGNTFDAHRLLHLARQRGKQGALAERLMRATHVEGRAIGDRDALVELAHQVGLDAAELRAVLDGDRFATEVRRDESIARELGVTGVPFFVFGGRFGVSGAQSIEGLLGALERGWAELRVPEPERIDDERALDGCA